MIDRSVQKKRPARAWGDVWPLRRLLVLALALGTGCGGEPGPAPAPPRRPAPLARYGPDGTPSAAPQPGPRPDLLLIVVPELRADHCGSATKGARVEATPRLEALAESGDAFGHAVTPVLEPGSALASLLTGLLPEGHGVSHRDLVPRLAPGFVTLGELLRRAGGYATRAFVADARLARAATLWQGFEVEPEVGLAEAPEAVSRWMRSVPTGAPRAAVLVADALGVGYGTLGEREAWRARLQPRLEQKPLAAWLATHWTFEPEALRETYAEGVRRADAQLGALLDRLEAEGQARNLLVIVTSTSGTGLLEHGVLGTGLSLHDEQVRIPLVFGGSVFLAGEGAAHKTASLVDVLPTLLDLLGLAEADQTDGVSLERVLLGEARRGPVRSVELVDGSNSGDPEAKALLHSARALGWKYMVRFDLRAGTVVESAFDLSEDVGEQRDLAREGSVAGVAFDASFCDGVEAVRDLVWGAAEGVNRLVDSAYSQGARVLKGRPAPCGK